MIVNLADTEQQVKLDLLGDTPGNTELWRLDRRQNPEKADVFDFPGDGKLSLPAQSFSLFIIDS
jgi:hypothetical protein